MSEKAHKFILSVTAGPNYKDQTPIPVNTSEATHFSSPSVEATLSIRIQNYRGLPPQSPKTSPYFSHPRHKSDLYSLSFTFTPKRDFNGHDLVLGNDFDHPIRDHLPPGFGQALKLATWFIDPGLYGDVHADEPYLYGPMLSSVNQFWVGKKQGEEGDKDGEEEGDRVVLEGGEGSGEEVRTEKGIPGEGAARQKFFLTEKNLREFTFEEGREYGVDFHNPYVDFNDFALKLPSFGVFPGITIPVLQYWDRQSLRYVLKDRKTDQPLIVIVINLIPVDEQGKEDESKKPETSSGGDDDELD